MHDPQSQAAMDRYGNIVLHSQHSQLMLISYSIIRQIITMDEEHIKFVLATGFNHFWRGRRQKERLLVSDPPWSSSV